MHEVFPIMAGAIVGLTVLRIASERLRTLAFVILSVVFGVAATIVSGEFAISWEFVMVDIPLVMLSAASVALLAPRARAWAAQRR